MDLDPTPAETEKDDEPKDTGPEYVQFYVRGTTLKDDKTGKKKSPGQTIWLTCHTARIYNERGYLKVDTDDYFSDAAKRDADAEEQRASGKASRASRKPPSEGRKRASTNNRRRSLTN